MANFQGLKRRGERALQYTAPVYEVDARGRLDLIGTGLFLHHLDHHFLLSAAHVITRLRDREIRIGGDDVVVPLTGRFFHTAANENDAHDVGFVPLTPPKVAELRGAQFMTIDQVAIGAAREGDKYYAVGFVARDYRLVPAGDPVEARATTLLAVAAPPAGYERRGVSTAAHLLLTFDRRTTYADRGVAETPKLHGMSGSGLWCFDDTARPADEEDKLAAILTEHHEGDRKVIVATKLGVLLRAIAAYAAGDLA
jgi:hypothetical protein